MGKNESVMNTSAIICETCRHNCEAGNMCVECDLYSKWKQKHVASQDVITSSCDALPDGTLNFSEREHYHDGSVVSKLKDRIDKMVSAHWAYVDAVIMSGADTSRSYTFDEVMEIRKFDYTSSAKHFYGHGFEDGEKTNVDGI